MGRAKLDEILTLFIYLELGAAVDSKELDFQTIIVVTGSILALTLAVLVLQIGASKFAPSSGAAAPHLDT